MSGPWFAIGLILVVALLAILLRRSSGGGDERAGTPPPPPVPPKLFEEDSEDEEFEEVMVPNEQAPVTAEGVALVRTGKQIALVSLVRSQEVPDWVRSGIEYSTVPYQVVTHVYGVTPPGAQAGRQAMTLSAGDFTAVRMGRDATAGGWRVETLGRDGDFGFFPFETEAGARLAMELLQQLGIVQVHLDEDQRPIPHSPEDFEEARRRYDQTERDLALGEPGEGLPPGDYSDRR